MITPVATSGAATITLAVSDQNFTSYAQFLYVLAPSNDPNLSFTRSKGVFVLDTGNCGQNLLNCDRYCGANCTYTTKFGTTIDLRDIDLQYIDSATDGYTLRVPWASIESPDAPGVRTYQYDFKIIENAITKLENVTPNQHLSIIIQGEPAYVDTMATQKWTSAKGPRALPWDSFLRARWHALMQAMASDVIPGEAMTLADHPVLTIINPSLPGGDSGIRDLQSGMDDVPFSSTLTGYSRPVLLAAIEDYLGSIQTYFPKKMVQIGFWKVLDDDTVQGDPPLWSYLRDNLATGVTGLMDSYAEFNGVERPRVGFWQEDLGAARLNVDPEYVSAVAPPSNQQYTSTPDPTFAAPLASIGSRGWVGFQMLDSWAGFFMDSHWPKMKNGSANDAMEAAYNTYYAQYFETYAAEIDDPAQQAARARWHGYLQTLTPPLEIPAGLTVITDTLHSPVQNVVSWFPVANATAYKLERADLLNDPNSWSQVTGSPTSLTSLNDTNQITSGMQWAYRVSASSGGPYTNVSPSVTTYLSEAVNDGYVMGPKGSATPTPFPSATDPGIRAGNTQSSRELRGFLSFNTNSLGSTATVLDARLRLTQVSTNDAFDAFGTCTVAIKQGNFNNNQTLEGLDFAATPTQPNVGQVPRMDGITNWVEVRLDPLLGVPYVFTTGRTQFRLQFDGLTSAVNSAGWSAGDVHGSEPQLLVRFK